MKRIINLSKAYNCNNKYAEDYVILLSHVSDKENWPQFLIATILCTNYFYIYLGHHKLTTKQPFSNVFLILQQRYWIL